MARGGRLRGVSGGVRLAVSQRFARISRNAQVLPDDLEKLPLERLPGSVVVFRLARCGCRNRRRSCAWASVMAGCTARRSDSRGVSTDRNGPALRAERIFVVFHVDRATAVLLP